MGEPVAASYREPGAGWLRQGLFSLAQVRRLLGLATRWEAQQFLGAHDVPVFDFDPAELDREAALQESADANRQSKRG